MTTTNTTKRKTQNNSKATRSNVANGQAVVIAKETHAAYREFCQTNGFKMGQLTTIIVQQFLDQQASQE